MIVVYGESDYKNLNIFLIRTIVLLEILLGIMGNLYYVVNIT